MRHKIQRVKKNTFSSAKRTFEDAQLICPHKHQKDLKKQYYKWQKTMDKERLLASCPVGSFYHKNLREKHGKPMETSLPPSVYLMQIRVQRTERIEMPPSSNESEKMIEEPSINLSSSPIISIEPLLESQMIKLPMMASCENSCGKETQATEQSTIEDNYSKVLDISLKKVEHADAFGQSITDSLKRLESLGESIQMRVDEFNEQISVAKKTPGKSDGIITLTNENPEPSLPSNQFVENIDTLLSIQAVENQGTMLDIIEEEMTKKTDEAPNEPIQNQEIIDTVIEDETIKKNEEIQNLSLQSQVIIEEETIKKSEETESQEITPEEETMQKDDEIPDLPLQNQEILLDIVEEETMKNNQRGKNLTSQNEDVIEEETGKRTEEEATCEIKGGEIQERNQETLLNNIGDEATKEAEEILNLPLQDEDMMMNIIEGEEAIKRSQENHGFTEEEETKKDLPNQEILPDIGTDQVVNQPEKEIVCEIHEIETHENSQEIFVEIIEHDPMKKPEEIVCETKEVEIQENVLNKSVSKEKPLSQKLSIAKAKLSNAKKTPLGAREFINNYDLAKNPEIENVVKLRSNLVFKYEETSETLKDKKPANQHVTWVTNGGIDIKLTKTERLRMGLIKGRTITENGNSSHSKGVSPHKRVGNGKRLL